MLNPYRTIELLAPAGDAECLRAAVAAGADAAYLGLEDFNARRNAGNFTLETLREACDFAHLRGVRIYLAINVEILPGEEERALELVCQAWRRGIDGAIVQDIGLASEVARVLPDLEIHISTQMNIHNVDGVRAVAALGASRVTFARELAFDELARLTEEAHALGMTTETFGHGALCVCYSGQCFMSSMVGSRSANRGMCAQACRLPYELRSASVDGALPSEGEHLLSPKDLSVVDAIPEIVATGVDSLKIEGRMKSADYVHTVVGIYRRALDRLADAFDAECSGMGDAMDAAETARAVPEEDRRALSEAFSRGFTTAYLSGRRGNDIMGYGRPNNRGVFVGRIADSTEGGVVFVTDVDLHAGDLLEFWTSRGNFVSEVPEGASEGEFVTLSVPKRAFKGDRVFRVRNASLAFDPRASVSKILVRAQVAMNIGKPLAIRLSSGATSVDWTGAVIEAARTKPVTLDEACEHIDRLGATPFEFSVLEVDLGEGVGIGFSALHKARTQALNALEDEMLSAYRGRVLAKRTKRRSLPPARTGDIRIVAMASNPACARAARKAGADDVYVPAFNYKRGTATVAGCLVDAVDQAGYPGRKIVAMPVVDKPAMNKDGGDFDPWQYVKSGKPLLAESFGEVVRGIEEGAAVEVGPHVPLTNRWSLDAVRMLGARTAWLSPELTLRQIKDLAPDAPIGLGLTVSGFQELMVAEHCMLMSEGPCDQRCGECVRRRSAHYYKDRKGYRFPIITDVCGRSHLYNGIALDIVHLLPELIEAGVSSFMVDATLLSVEEASEAVSRAVRARSLALNGGSAVDKLKGRTTGHMFRPVE